MDTIPYLEKTLDNAIGRQLLIQERRDKDFLDRIKGLSEDLYALFRINELNEYLEDSSKCIGFALPNKTGDLPVNTVEETDAKRGDYWLNPAELAISNLGDIASIREPANMLDRDLTNTLEVLKKHNFIYIPWDIMRQKPPAYVTWNDSWWNIYFHWN